MKNRLKALLCNVVCRGDDRREGGCGLRKDDRCDRIEKLDMCMIECITDHLLTEGVIVPPCKVGQIVYVLRSKTSNGKNLYLREERISHYRIFDERSFMCFESERLSVADFLWDTTVFLTREEAEKALVERSGQ